MFFVAPAAHATSVRPLSIDDLARDATLVVVGHSDVGESHWQGGRIVTRTRVQVLETWVGGTTPGDVIEVTTLGGVVGEIGQMVSGAAPLYAGERLVLFLRAAGERLVPIELGQGVFYVARGADGVDRVARHKDADAASATARMLPSTLDELRQRTLEAKHAR